MDPMHEAVTAAAVCNLVSTASTDTTTKSVYTNTTIKEPASDSASSASSASDLEKGPSSSDRQVQRSFFRKALTRLVRALYHTGLLVLSQVPIWICTMTCWTPGVLPAVLINHPSCPQFPLEPLYFWARYGGGFSIIFSIFFALFFFALLFEKPGKRSVREILCDMLWFLMPFLGVLTALMLLGTLLICAIRWGMVLAGKKQC